MEKKMEKRKLFEHVGAIAVICGFAFLALGSGTLDGSSASQKTGNWILDWESEHLVSLEKYEIVYKDNPRSMPKALENASLFGRANWFSAILNTFELQDKLSIEQKLQLFDALFNYVPGGTQDMGYRIVSLGKFKSGKSLQFLLGAVKLNQDALQGAHGLQMYSNCSFLDTDNGRSFVISELRLGTINWRSLGMVFPDGRVIRGNNLYDEANVAKWKEESGDSEAALAINLSDLYIKDEIKENDAEAFAMLEKAMAAPSDNPSIDVAVRLNYFLCLLSESRVDEAESLLAEATELYQKLEEPESGLYEAVELEAPTLLAIYRKAGL